MKKATPYFCAINRVASFDTMIIVGYHRFCHAPGHQGYEPSHRKTVAAVLVGVSCFNENCVSALWADTTDILSAGLDAEASVRTVPALRANFLLKATFLGILMHLVIEDC